MKKVFIYLTCILAVLECGGCRKTDEELADEVLTTETPATDAKEIDPVVFPAAYTKEMDHVVFNTEIIVNEEVSDHGLYKTTASYQTLNKEKAYDLLFGEIEIGEHWERDTEMGAEMYYVGNQMHESLYMIKNHLSLTKGAAFNYARHSFHLEGDNYNADLYLTGESFEFKRIDEAYRELSEVLSELDLDITGKYNCYSLDYKTMEENEYVAAVDEEKAREEYKDNWTKDDNGYFFAVHQTLQGCTVQYPLAEVFRQVCDANAPVQALYTHNGIVYMDIYDLFTFQQSDEPLALKSFDEVADTIAYKFNMILTEDKYEVKRAELFFRPVEGDQESFEMIPAWEVTIREASTERTLYMYVNALTAEEML